MTQFVTFESSQTLTYESTRRIVETPDYRIQVNEAGQGHPVFLIHGTGPGATGWSNFEPNLPALSQKYRCIAVTMPGWGESSPQDVSSGRDQAAAIVQLMDALSIDRAAFVGNSMGGGIALVMAAKHPERVSHIITMGAGIWGVNVMSPGGMSEGFGALMRAYEEPTPENFLRLVQVMCFDPRFATPELAAQRARGALEHPEHLTNWLACMRAGVGHDAFLEVAGALPGTQVPALIIHGRDDRTVHYETSLRALSLLPNSRMVLLNRCGHWAQLEHAEEFNHMVDNFLTQH